MLGFRPSKAKYAAISRARALTHIGTDQPFTTASHLRARRKPCMTAIKRKIRPTTRENVFWLMDSSPPAERGDRETLTRIVPPPRMKKVESARRKPNPGRIVRRDVNRAAAQRCLRQVRVDLGRQIQHAEYANGAAFRV